jgi:hypothetical protein
MGRIGDRADAVDDVQSSDDQQEDRGEDHSACTSHVGFLLFRRPPARAAVLCSRQAPIWRAVNLAAGIPRRIPRHT